MTPENPHPLTHTVLAVLNDAFRLDAPAVAALLQACVPVNNELAEHPHIVVYETDKLPDNPLLMNPLGVINGVLSAAGAPLIQLDWAVEGTKTTVCRGFKAVVPNGTALNPPDTLNEPSGGFADSKPAPAPAKHAREDLIPAPDPREPCSTT